MSWTSLSSLSCSWHDKLIVLWILNRQAKISLRITKVLSHDKLADKFGNFGTKVIFLRVTPKNTGN